jgi:glucose/arabinose dehydrogenase
MVAGAPALGQSAQPVEQGDPNVPEFEPAFPEQNRAPVADSGVTLAVETFAEPLEHPWGIDVLPNGGYVVTELPGRMRLISENGKISDPIEGIPDVLYGGQGGLLDVAVGPTFAEDRRIYWSYARSLEDGKTVTVATRGRLSEDGSEVTEVEDIFVQEPPSPTPAHYGSRIVFDGDGHVFITTGDHFTEAERVLAQQLGTSYGKVIRVNLDGSIPKDNPFVDAQGAIGSIWTMGHRNIQGAAIHPESGRLWTIEHGPQGGDELNPSEPGANYGWPVVSYGENYDGSPVGEGVERHGGEFVEPRYYWDPVIAPGGMLFYRGDLFTGWRGDLLISSMVPGALVRIELDGETVIGEERLLKDHGRIRDIVEAPDGALLVLVDAAMGAVLRLTPNESAAASVPREAWRAEGFDRPESVVFDNARNVLYVSNVGEDEDGGQGYISKLTRDGKVTEAKWVEGLKGPKGMAVHGDRLHVSDVDRLVVIDVEAGEIVATYDAPDAEFLNDVAADRDGRVFVSDMNGNAIYVLDGEEFSMWLADEALMQPNGLLAEEDRLVVAAWGEGEGARATSGHLITVDYDTKSIESLGDGTPIGNLDGIEPDGEGNYLVTDWVAGALYRIRPTGKAEQLLDLNEGSADLEYRAGLAIIPMMMDGELRAWRVD